MKKTIKRLTACVASAGLFIGSITCVSARSQYAPFAKDYQTFDDLWGDYIIHDLYLSFYPDYPVKPEDSQYCAAIGKYIKYGWFDLRVGNIYGESELGGRVYSKAAKKYEHKKYVLTKSYTQDITAPFTPEDYFVFGFIPFK